MSLTKYFSLFTLLLAISFLSGCLYESAPSQPAAQIDTWLLGKWVAQDKSGKVFEAIITPQDNTHYEVVIYNKDKNQMHPWHFEGWVAQVDHLKFLTLRSLDTTLPEKYLFLHYELMTPEEAPVNGVGATRIRIMEPQLPLTAQHLDAFHLRQAIRTHLKQGNLLVPEGFSVWTRTEDVFWPASQK